MDAVATPFVQGQLRKSPLTVTIDSECAHCGLPLHIELTHDMQYQVQEADADPILFFPLVDFEKLKDPNIIDAF